MFLFGVCSRVVTVRFCRFIGEVVKVQKGSVKIVEEDEGQLVVR